MSERSEIAQRIADFIIKNNLAQIFGGEVRQSNDKKYYSIGFSIARYVDGEVRVYGPKFILIKSVGPLSSGDKILTSEENAINYLKFQFVEANETEADKILVLDGKKF